MTRLICTSCGVVAEVAALEAAQSPLLMGLAAFSLLAGALAWWIHFQRLIDRIIGLDLPHVDTTQFDAEAD